MQCTIRPWELTDAADLSSALNNPKIQANLRDGLPFPYTAADAESFIRAMQNAEPNSQYTFAIDVAGKAIGSIGAFGLCV